MSHGCRIILVGFDRIKLVVFFVDPIKLMFYNEFASFIVTFWGFDTFFAALLFKKYPEAFFAALMPVFGPYSRFPVDEERPWHPKIPSI